MNIKSTRIFAHELLKTLEQAGYAARLAGGCVRDHLLGITPKDYDIATNATPEKVCALFKQKGYRVLETGLEFGTVTIMKSMLGVEITTLRKDVATDGRHATVEYSNSFEEDASRRDFTVNAMYEDLHGKIYDFHDGQKDLQSKKLKFVGESQTRVHEDYLRILRMYRFWASYGLTPNHEAREACKKGAQGLKKISGERIQSELSKILDCTKVQHISDAMSADKIFEFSSGGVLEHSHSHLELLTSNLDLASYPLWLRRLALLCVQNKVDSSKLNILNKRLKLSGFDARLLAGLLELPQQIEQLQLRSVADSLSWVDQFEKGFKRLFQAEILQEYLRQAHPSVIQSATWLKLVADVQKHQQLRLQPFPIDGNLLCQELQIKPSEELGRLLIFLRRGYYNQLWKTSDQALNLAKDWLKSQ